MINHYFFGKNCKIDRELSNHSDLEKCLKERDLKFDAINFVSQIHSNKVYVIDSADKIQPKQGLAKADAIVTNQEKLAIAIVTADCAPIILKDEVNKVIAVVHAGWRGAKDGVIENTIDEMVNLGADLDSIQGFIGPMIHQDSYQVSQEFFDDFLAQDNSHIQFFKDDGVKGKYLFDLVGFVYDILEKKGVKNIDNVNVDTYKSDDYSSYRLATHQNNDLSERNISVTGIF